MTLSKRLLASCQSFRRECNHGMGYATSWFIRRLYYRFIKRRLPVFGRPWPRDSEQALTVIVPAAEKDATVLPHCLHSIRAMIQQPLAAVWVVAPESAPIRQIAADAECQFILEDDVLPRPAAALKCRGWVLQQFIKFNCSSLVTTPDYLVVDADTVFLRPQSFFRRGKAVLRYSDQYELLYNRSLQLVYGHPRRFPVSFVTHHMLFNSELVKQLLRLIEQRFGRPWWDAILHEVDKGHPISFSEFELYGHFVLSQRHWRKGFCLEYWNGLDRHTSDLAEFEMIRQGAAVEQLNTVSFHWHTQ